MDQRDYRKLRDEHSRATEKLTERDENPSPVNQREGSRDAPRDPVDDFHALQKTAAQEQLVKHYWARQRGEAAEAERNEKRLAHLKEHDPIEYAREMKDRERKQEWGLRRAENPDERSERKGDDERSRDSTDTSRDENKWRDAMSDNTRQTVDEARQREVRERERDRSR